MTSARTLILCTRGKTLPPMVSQDQIGRNYVVLTEAEHIQVYDDMSAVHVVRSFQDLQAVRETVLGILKAQPLSGVWAPSEGTVAVAGYLRSCFQLPGDSFDVAIRFANKAAMKSCLSFAGIPVAPFRVVYSLAQVPQASMELGWPLVVKPSVGGGGHNVVMFRTPAEFDRYFMGRESEVLRNIGVPLVVESMVHMSAEFHVDGIVDEGEQVFAAAFRYFNPLLDFSNAKARTPESAAMVGSYSLPASDPMRDQLITLHHDVVRTLGLRWGVTHMEAYETQSGLLVGEIACRPGGSGIPRAVQLQYGVDLWAASHALSIGRKPVIDVVEQPGYLARCNVPVKPGRVTSISSPEVLTSSVPSIADVRVLLRVGDDVPASLDAAAAAALVHFREPDVGAVMRTCEAIEERFEVLIDSAVTTS